MSWFTRFVDSSVGRKTIMAFSGLGLYVFVILHMLGNLQIFEGPAALNDYAYKLQSLGPLLWVARILLLLIFIIHIYYGIVLTLRNKWARPVPYATKKYIYANLPSRTMIWSGLAILGFVILHLIHFTFGLIHPDYYNVVDPLGHHDVYRMVVRGFQDPLIVVIYVVSMLLLGMHLWHGASSLWQSLGINHPKYEHLLRSVGPVSAVILAGGNILIVLSVFFGLIHLPA